MADYYYPGVDKVFLINRAGTEDDPYIPLTQTNVVKYQKVELIEIPDFTSKVTVEDANGVFLNEVTKAEVGVNEYLVDYSTGLVKFNAAQENGTYTFSYKGIGRLSFPASRIVVDTGVNNEQELNLQQILDSQGSIATQINQMLSKVTSLEQLIIQNQVVKKQDMENVEYTQLNISQTVNGQRVVTPVYLPHEQILKGE
ncbi:hypothetical protein NL868_001303 [Shigella flexneri]|nr:hypothetical protein [Shigella flexneri]